MGYIGTPIDTRNQFQSLQGKRFNGDGSTTDFTLDVAPGSTLDIEVFVGNVRQDPNSAYTLSGTTLSFTGAPPSGTNNIYVVHQAKSVGTIDVPATNSGNTTFNGTMTMNGGVVLNEESASVDFRVESNGDTNCLIVDGSGDKVGIGEDVPEGKLHVFTGDASIAPNANADELVVEGSGDSGVSILSGSSSNGSILFGDSGDDNIGGIDYDHNGDSMSFIVNTSTVMQLDPPTTGSGGGTNTLKVSHDFDTADNVMINFLNTDDSSNDNYLLQLRYGGKARDNNSTFFVNCEDNAAGRLNIYADGDVKNHDNSYGAISDERIKQDIVDANSQWDDIKAIKVRNFKKKDDVRQYGDKAWTQIGVIAQELELVSPKLIKDVNPNKADIKSSSEFGTLYTEQDETDGKIPEGFEVGDIKEIKEKVKGVSYSVLYMKAIKALQEAQTRIETLEAKVKALEEA